MNLSNLYSQIAFKSWSLNGVPSIILIQNWMNYSEFKYSITTALPPVIWATWVLYRSRWKNNITWLMQAVKFMRRRPSLGAAMMKWKFITGLPKSAVPWREPRVQEMVHAYVCAARTATMHSRKTSQSTEMQREELHGEAVDDYYVGW